MLGEIHGEGTSLLEAMLHHCIVMDWLTIALALIHGKDPAAIAPIQCLDQRRPLANCS